ncbi:MAG: hypothetical protein ACREE9_04610 [Stellaceae bacterium]
MKRMLRWAFILLGVVFGLVVIGEANRPSAPPGTPPLPAGAAPTAAASRSNVVIIPAAPTNPYLSLSVPRLFAHVRDLDRRMVAANRPYPKDGTPLVTNREIDETEDALSAIPKTARQYRVAQNDLALLARREKEGERASDAYHAKQPVARPGAPQEDAEPSSPYIDQLREAAGPALTGGITPRQYEAAAAMIRLKGYDCPRADLMTRFVFSEGYDVYCRGGRYEFELANHGGQWTVTPP